MNISDLLGSKSFQASFAFKQIVNWELAPPASEVQKSGMEEFILYLRKGLFQLDCFLACQNLVDV